MIGAYDFSLLDTTPGAPRTLLAALPGEDPGAYRLRLREAWKTNPQVRQHLWLYARHLKKGRLRIVGPMQDVIEDVLRSL
jgi:hypothetical protein